MNTTVRFRSGCQADGNASCTSRFEAPSTKTCKWVPLFSNCLYTLGSEEIPSPLISWIFNGAQRAQCNAARNLSIWRARIRASRWRARYHVRPVTRPKTPRTFEMQCSRCNYCEFRSSAHHSGIGGNWSSRLRGICARRLL